MQHARLVEQCEPALGLQNTLDHEHHVRAAGIVLVEHQRGRVLKGPGQHAFLELGHLHAVADHDRILADEVDAADVAVEIDAYTRPIETGSDLLYVRGFAGTVVALDQHPAVVGEAGQDGERGVVVETICFVHTRDVFTALAEGGYLEVAFYAKGLVYRDSNVRNTTCLLFRREICL